MRPIPVNVIQALDTATRGTTPRNIYICDFTWGTLFLIIRTREYFKRDTDNAHHSYQLKDVQLFIVQQPYNYATAPNSAQTEADLVSLLFMTQKNGVKGELTGNGKTVHIQGCPVVDVHRQMA